MNFLEQHDGGCFSAEQLALAEAEIEEKRLEWEKNRLEALRLEQMELDKRNAQDDENYQNSPYSANDLTYPRDDALNQVNETNNSSKIGRKRNRVRLKRKLRKKARINTNDTVESTVNDDSNVSTLNDDSKSAMDASDDDLPVSSFRNSSVVENNTSDSKPKTLTKLINSDVNSPRTRSTGKIPLNLWTLDVSPILPGVKPIVNKVTKNGPGKLKNSKLKSKNKNFSGFKSVSDTNLDLSSDLDSDDDSWVDDKCETNDSNNKNSLNKLNNTVVLDALDTELIINNACTKLLNDNHISKMDEVCLGNDSDLGIERLPKKVEDESLTEIDSSTQSVINVTQSNGSSNKIKSRSRKWAIMPSNNRTLDSWLVKSPKNISRENCTENNISGNKSIVGKTKTKKFLKQTSDDIMIKRKTRQSVSLAKSEGK